jgi:hypothetical protein
MPEQRSHPRLPEADLVMISWEEGPTTSFQLGNLEDISQGGIGMIADHPLRVGMEVTISYGEGGLKATVRHCQAMEDGYLIGVEFVGNSKDLSLQLQPELLFWPS